MLNRYSLLLLLLAGCTSVEISYRTDPLYTEKSFRSAIVFFPAPADIRERVEHKLSACLTRRGVKSQASLDRALPSPLLAVEEYLNGVKPEESETVLVITRAEVTSEKMFIAPSYNADQGAAMTEYPNASGYYTFYTGAHVELYETGSRHTAWTADVRDQGLNKLEILQEMANKICDTLVLSQTLQSSTITTSYVGTPPSREKASVPEKAWR